MANRIKFNKLNQEKLIAKLTHDIAMLDSLKSAYNLNLHSQATKSSDASRSVILGESGVIDPVGIYVEGVTLFELLQEAKLEYELGSHFELIDGFTTFSSPQNPTLKNNVLSNILTFLAIAYGLIILLELNKYLNRIEKEGFKD